LDRQHLVTERLHLNPITMADVDRLAVLHADARVMNLLKHGVLSRARSDALVADYAAEWPALSFGSAGKGYGPELGRAALAFAFNIVGLDRVVAITRPDDLPGQRALEKFGMRREREMQQENGRTVLLYAAFNPKTDRARDSLSRSAFHHRRMTDDVQRRADDIRCGVRRINDIGRQREFRSSGKHRQLAALQVRAHETDRKVSGTAVLENML
jgi:[ribosomal protein S5]-alanine N-acetyltransferase